MVPSEIVARIEFIDENGGGRLKKTAAEEKDVQGARPSRSVSTALTPLLCNLAAASSPKRERGQQWWRDHRTVASNMDIIANTTHAVGKVCI
jgi:predicted cupin superfamily sugar epimerase